MILSATVQKQIQTQFTQLLTTKSTSSLCRTLQNTSVMLSGTTPGGQAFTGSGVILYSDTDAGFAYVVTAKHNLYIFAGQSDPPATWDPTVLTKFQQAIKISYDGAMSFRSSPGRSASIDAIQTVDIPAPETWTYDVMILKSKDPDLMGFAKTNNLYPLEQAERNVVLNPQTYLQRASQNYFIQTGFGFVRDTASNRNRTRLPLEPAGTNTNQTLQYRFTQPKTRETNTVYNQFSTNPSQYYQFQNGIQVEANANDSTAPGDSGGPLFLLSFASGGWGLYLIGVTSGSDMALAETPCPADPAILENNIVTSLEVCYRQSIF